MAAKADYEVMRGFWVEDDKFPNGLRKVHKGAIVELSAEDAIDRVESGLLKKAPKKDPKDK